MEGAASVGSKRALSASSQVRLTPAEAGVLKVLSEAKQFAGRDTTIRVVGGWVRDKVLGLESDDIDIALDDMAGAEFAECVQAYLKEQGTETSRLAVIERNPEQSKHLETATMKIEGISIDFVGLRAEEYAAGSRIPEVRLGTAEEDALRRDLTINALFYRVDSGAVEDLTGRGLGDLRAGIARTPLEPMQTFTDDPLRVLRSVRFATRFDLQVDGALAEAAASDSVRAALDSKVSRERLGVEVSKMFEGPDPVRAAYLLASLSLWDVVFRMPELELIHRQEVVRGAMVSSAPTLPAEGVGRAGLHCMLLVHRLSQPAAPTANLAPARRSLLWWSGIFLPCRRLATKFKKAGTQTVVEYMHRESLKGLPLADAKQVDLIINAVEALSGAVRAQAAGEALDRVAVGLLLCELKELWRPALLVACAAEIYAELGPSLIAAEQAGGAWAEPSATQPEPEAGRDPAAESTAARESRAAVLASDALPPSCTLTLSRRGRPELDFGVAFTPAHLQLMGSYMEFATHLEAVELHEPWKMKRFFSVRETQAHAHRADVLLCAADIASAFGDAGQGGDGSSGLEAGPSCQGVRLKNPAIGSERRL